MQQELRIRIKVDKQTGELSAIDGEFNKLTDSTKKADTATQSYIDKLKNIVSGVAGIYAIKKAFDVVTSSLSALLGTAGEFEKFESVLTTLEGSSNKAKLSFAWIKEFAAKTPYLLTGVTDAFVKLRSYGIDPIGGTLKTLGDTSAAMGKPLMQAVEAMADAVVGENERLKEFGIRASMNGEKIAYSWSDASGKAKYIVIDNNSQIIQSTLNAIFNSKYQDAMQNMMSTWNGLTSNMEDNWTSFKNTVALQSGLFDGAKAGIKEFNAQFSKIEQNQEIMNALGNTVFSVAEGIVGATIAVSYPIKGVAYIVKTVETAFSQLGDQSGYVFENMKVGAYSAQKAVNSLNPFGDIGTTIDLEQKITKAKTLMNGYKASYQQKDDDWYNFIKNTEDSSKALDAVKEAFTSAKTKMVAYQGATKQTTDEIVKQKVEVVGSLDGVYSTGSNKLQSEYKKALEAIKDDTAKLTKSEYEYGLYLIDEKVKDYRKAGVGEIDIATWVSASKAKLIEAETKKTKEESEKQAKEFEEQFKNRIDSYKTYYTSLDNVQELFYIEESEKLEKLAKAGILSNEQMLTVWAKDNEKFRDEQFKKNNEWLYDFFDNVNKALDEQLLGGMKGKFSSFGDWMKSTFNTIGDSMLAGLSRSLSGSVTGSLENSILNAMRSNYSLGLSTLGDGSTVSASEIAALMNAGGTFDSATNSITTAGGTAIKLSENGTGTVEKGGSDILSLASTVSSLKTAYSVLTGGISSSLMSGFNGVSDVLASQGYWSAANGVSNFGYGFANPLSNYSVGSGAFGSTMAGGMLSSGLLGYGMGSLGDMLFGADTKAGIGGAAGAAIGSIIPGVGTIVGGLIGSALGGLFGSKKITDTGYNFLSDATSNNIDVMGYSNWKKKSWFSSSKGSTPIDLEAADIKQIESVFDTYDYLLMQLGDSDKIWLDAGKYSKTTYQDALSKNFIKAFSDIDQGADDTIYKTWKDYADGLNETIIKAMSDSISTYVSSTRDFEKWSLERDGKTLESLQKQAQWAQSDFESLANMIGATGITVENYTQMYAEAIKTSFDADTITKWQSLGTALQTATNAADSYKNSVISSLNSQLTAWVNALGSIQGAIDALSPTFKSLEELKSSALNIDNYSTLLSQLESTRQAEINKLTTASQVRINQLNNEKTLFQSLSQYIDELNLKLRGTSTITSDYFFDELTKAKSVFENGGIVNTSSLTKSASTYLESALQNSTSQLEYFREIAKVKKGLDSLGDMVTGGTLESVEAAIKNEEQTLAEKLDALNQTALSILNGWKGTATSNISTIAGQINTVQAVDPSITAAYENILGRAPESAGGNYWQSLLNTGTLDATNITSSIATAAIQELYSTVLGRVSDSAGLEHWTNIVQSGTIDPNKLDELFKQAAQAEINGSHAGGLKRVPFNDYIAKLHEGERVQTSAEAKRDDVLLLLIEKIEDLTKIMVSKKADDIRLRQLFERLSPDGDALQTRDVA